MQGLRRRIVYVALYEIIAIAATSLGLAACGGRGGGDTALPQLAPAQAETKAASSRPMPLIPVAEMEEILAEGDAALAHNDAVMEPVPSTFYDEFDATPVAAAGGRR